MAFLLEPASVSVRMLQVIDHTTYLLKRQPAMEKINATLVRVDKTIEAFQSIDRMAHPRW